VLEFRDGTAHFHSMISVRIDIKPLAGHADLVHHRSTV